MENKLVQLPFMPFENTVSQSKWFAENQNHQFEVGSSCSTRVHSVLTLH